MTEKVINERITSTPVNIKGIAMKSGVSRNNNLYTDEWINQYMTKLVNAPIYFEHIRANAAIGKVTRTEMTPDGLYYEGEILDDNVGLQIKNGLIQHVSIGYDYKTREEIDGHNYYVDPFNAELSLVAAPGIPDATIVAESVGNHISESMEGTNVEPFGGYTDFDDCVAKNSDKADPKAYCATIMHKVEAAVIEEKDKRIKELEEAYAKVTKADEELRKSVDDRVKQARIDANKEFIKQVNGVIPHEGISNRWNLGAKRFVQEVRKVTINKEKECK